MCVSRPTIHDDSVPDIESCKEPRTTLAEMLKDAFDRQTSISFVLRAHQLKTKGNKRKQTQNRSWYQFGSNVDVQYIEIEFRK